MEELWAMAQLNLEKVLRPETFEDWIKPLGYGEGQGQTILLIAPDEFTAKIVRMQFGTLLTEAISVAAGQEIFVCIRSSEDLYQFHFKEFTADERLTFEAFLPGHCNELAVEGARTAADPKGHLYNPLVIYGHAGMGKTHLLHAVANETRRTLLSTKARYVSAEALGKEVLQAMKYGELELLRNRYMDLDHLLIDDLQKMSRDEKTQETLYELLRHLCMSEKQVVLTSGTNPRKATWLQKDLAAFFASGLIVEIQPPDKAFKIHFVKKKAKELSFYVPEKIIHQLARHKSTDKILFLTGVINTLHAYTALGREITPALVKDLLDEQ